MSKNPALYSLPSCRARMDSMQNMFMTWRFSARLRLLFLMTIWKISLHLLAGA